MIHIRASPTKHYKTEHPVAWDFKQSLDKGAHYLDFLYNLSVKDITDIMGKVPDEGKGALFAMPISAICENSGKLWEAWKLVCKKNKMSRSKKGIADWSKKLEECKMSKKIRKLE